MAQEKAKHCVAIARGRINGTMALMTKKRKAIVPKKVVA